MSGRQKAERTFSDALYRLQKCSLRQVQQVQFTVCYLQVLLQQLILLHRVFFL